MGGSVRLMGVLSGGGKCHLPGLERSEQIESREVGHRGGEERLQLGLAPSPVPRLLRSEVLEVIDLPLDDRPAPELALDRRALGLRSGLDQPGLVNIDGDRPAAASLHAPGSQGAGGTHVFVEHEEDGGPALVVAPATGTGGGDPRGAGGGGGVGVDRELGLGEVPRVVGGRDLGHHLGPDCLHLGPGVLAGSTNGAAWSPSEPLPGPTSTASTISVDSSSMRWSLWRLNRREADLRPWRISGSVTDTMRSAATPRRIRGSPVSGSISTSWSTMAPSIAAARAASGRSATAASRRREASTIRRSSARRTPGFPQSMSGLVSLRYRFSARQRALDRASSPTERTTWAIARRRSS